MSTKCAYHPEISAGFACMQCGALICGDCKRRVKNKPTCWRCAGEASAPIVQAPEPEPESSVTPALETEASIATPYYSKQRGQLTSGKVLKSLGAAIVISLVGGIVWEKIIYYAGVQWPYGNLFLGILIGAAVKACIGRPSNLMAIVSGVIAAAGVLLGHWLLLADVIAGKIGVSRFNPILWSAAWSMLPGYMRSLPIWHWLVCGASIFAAILVPSTLMRERG